MTNEEVARESERLRNESNLRAEMERNTSSKERAQEINARNAERKQQKKTATEILEGGDVNTKLSEIAKQGGSLGRKLEREIRQFEQTGRVSNWLRGETIKAEAAQKSAQQSAFNRAVRDVVSINAGPTIIGSTRQYTQLSKKPEIPSAAIAEGEDCVGLNIYINQNNVWVNAGIVAGELPAEFNPQNGKFVSSSGSGNVWVKIEINDLTGEITSREANGGGTTPPNTNTSFYYTLGYYSYDDQGIPSVTNYGCGSVDATVCRNWFAAEAPFYGVNFSRTGS